MFKLKPARILTLFFVATSFSVSAEPTQKDIPPGPNILDGYEAPFDLLKAKYDEILADYKNFQKQGKNVYSLISANDLNGIKSRLASIKASKNRLDLFLDSNNANSFRYLRGQLEAKAIQLEREGKELQNRYDEYRNKMSNSLEDWNDFNSGWTRYDKREWLKIKPEEFLGAEVLAKIYAKYSIGDGLSISIDKFLSDDGGGYYSSRSRFYSDKNRKDFYHKDLYEGDLWDDRYRDSGIFGKGIYQDILDTFHSEDTEYSKTWRFKVNYKVGLWYANPLAEKQNADNESSLQYYNVHLDNLRVYDIEDLYSSEYTTVLNTLTTAKNTIEENLKKAREDAKKEEVKTFANSEKVAVEGLKNTLIGAGFSTKMQGLRAAASSGNVSLIDAEIAAKLINENKDLSVSDNLITIIYKAKNQVLIEIQNKIDEVDSKVKNYYSFEANTYFEQMKKLQAEVQALVASMESEFATLEDLKDQAIGNQTSGSISPVEVTIQGFIDQINNSNFHAEMDKLKRAADQGNVAPIDAVIADGNLATIVGDAEQNLQKAIDEKARLQTELQAYFSEDGIITKLSGVTANITTLADLINGENGVAIRFTTLETLRTQAETVASNAEQQKENTKKANQDAAFAGFTRNEDSNSWTADKKYGWTFGLPAGETLKNQSIGSDGVLVILTNSGKIYHKQMAIPGIPEGDAWTQVTGSTEYPDGLEGVTLSKIICGKFADYNVAAIDENDVVYVLCSVDPVIWNSYGFEKETTFFTETTVQTKVGTDDSNRSIFEMISHLIPQSHSEEYTLQAADASFDAAGTLFVKPKKDAEFDFVYWANSSQLPKLFILDDIDQKILADAQAAAEQTEQSAADTAATNALRKEALYAFKMINAIRVEMAVWLSQAKQKVIDASVFVPTLAMDSLLEAQAVVRGLQTSYQNKKDVDLDAILRDPEVAKLDTSIIFDRSELRDENLDGLDDASLNLSSVLQIINDLQDEFNAAIETVDGHVDSVKKTLTDQRDAEALAKQQQEAALGFETGTVLNIRYQPSAQVSWINLVLGDGQMSGETEFHDINSSENPSIFDPRTQFEFELIDWSYKSEDEHAGIYYRFALRAKGTQKYVQLYQGYPTAYVIALSPEDVISKDNCHFIFEKIDDETGMTRIKSVASWALNDPAKKWFLGIDYGTMVVKQFPESSPAIKFKIRPLSKLDTYFIDPSTVPEVVAPVMAPTFPSFPGTSGPVFAPPSLPSFGAPPALN